MVAVVTVSMTTERVCFQVLLRAVSGRQPVRPDLLQAEDGQRVLGRALRLLQPSLGGLADRASLQGDRQEEEEGQE